jgi:N6-L-threonylcarbamoyladenine synthase
MAVILALETSCDETACAVVQDREVLASVVSSQIEVHKRYGGVVPEVASRQHVLTINPVIEETLATASIRWEAIDGIGVTCGPGLVGSLLTGVMAAKTLAWIHQKPLIAVHHLEGHLYSAFLAQPALEPPFLCLLVSGGHTMLIHIRAHGHYEILGQTRDDAAGEAYDKTARLLGLPYPGGPAIDRLAREGNPRAFAFPKGKVDHPYDTSFSGLKTAVRRTVEQLRSQLPREEFPLSDLCASFQKAVVEVLVEKSMHALEHLNLSTLVVCGGVAANRGLRARLEQESKQRGAIVVFPAFAYCTDNAAMIGCVAAQKYKQGLFSNWEIGVFSRMELDQTALLYGLS